MTLPDEKYRAVMQTKKFLLEILPHYHSDWGMARADNSATDVFAQQIQAVPWLFKSHKAEKNEQA